MPRKPTCRELERRIRELEAERVKLLCAEKALREGEERFRKIFEDGPVGIVLTSRNMGFFGANPAFCRMIGYRPEELVGKTFLDFTHPEYRKLDRENVAKMWRGELPHYRTEKRYIAKNGDIRWGSLSASLIRASDGEPVYALAMIEDITDRKRTEAALRESENRYRTFFEKGPDGIVIIDPATSRPIEFNEQAYRQLGYSHEEFARLRLSDIEAKETAEETEAHIRKIMEQGNDDFETLQRTKDGKIRHVHVTAQIIKTARGNVYQSIWRDITERKRSEELLTALNMIAQSVNQSLDLDQVLNTALDEAMKLFRLHSAAIRLLDNQTKELVAAAQKGLLSEEIKKMADRLKPGEGASGLALKSKEVVVIEDLLNDPRANQIHPFAIELGCRSLVTFPLQVKDKLVGTMGLRASEPRSYNAEEISLFKSIGNQIGTAIENANLFTQVKQYAKMLEALNSVSQTVNQSLDLDKVLSVSLEKVIELLKVDGGIIRLLSENNRELVLRAHRGFTSEQTSKLPLSRKYGYGTGWKALTADRVENIAFNPDDASQQKIGSFGRAIGARNAILFPLKSKDHMLGIMSLYSFAPRVITKQEIEHSAVIINQIGIAIENAKVYSEKEAAINNLIEIQKKLQQAQKMESIGTLTGGLSHDFNNILSIIIGNAELALHDVPEWNPVHSNLEEIKTASLRATKIVKQLLSFSRREDQKLEPIEIAPVIKDALKFLRATIPTTIDIHQDIQVENETILANPIQINQIMMNLCINASHAMETTGGNLTVRVEKVILDDNTAKGYPDLKIGAHIKVTVSDTGTGIAPKVIDRIFDPYFTTKDVGKGSGMGLAVVHGIVKSHNGAISVESKPGRGSTFSILFPETTRKAVMEVKTLEEIPRGNESIFLIDDEDSIAEMTRQMLERLGYRVETRLNPLEALAHFQANPDRFDLVITDMTMPKMTGAMLSEKVLEIRPDIPIIVCTGHSILIDEAKAKQSGIAAYVMKPIHTTEIAKTIRKVMDGAKSRTRP